jgi:leucyl aminopeptidase
MIELTPVAGLAEPGRASAIPLRLLTVEHFAAYKKTQPKHVSNWLSLHRFKPEPGRSIMVADATGGIDHVLVGVLDMPDNWALASLPAKLPQGLYTLDMRFLPAFAEDSELQARLAFGWGAACYRFSAFRTPENHLPLLRLSDRTAHRKALHLLKAAYLARDLINLPANHLGPRELLAHTKAVGEAHGAKVTLIQGDALLKRNFPAIHAVGRAADNPPGLADLRWGNPSHPKVTLVGKGVCFDSGGLDIKSSSNMRLMKKDMGGAAVLLALAQLIMERKLPVCLRLLIPAVENSISSNAFRPGDVIASRKGLTIEIGNTDAEGRVILCDALAEADSESPDLLIDCATLTGAARVALGTDIPAFFTPSNQLAEQLQKLSEQEEEPLWRLPLFPGYEDLLESKIADISNSPESPYAGAIAAALFLKRFVEKTPQWVHLDMMAWNVRPRPGRPAGGEAHALRSLFRLVENLANTKSLRSGRKSKK